MALRGTWASVWLPWGVSIWAHMWLAGWEGLACGTQDLHWRFRMTRPPPRRTPLAHTELAVRCLLRHRCEERLVGGEHGVSVALL